MTPRAPNEVTIEWPVDKPLPACGSVIDAGELGKAYVMAIETPWRPIYKNIKEEQCCNPSAIVYDLPSVTVVFIPEVRV